MTRPSIVGAPAGAAKIELNRPEALNAWDAGLGPTCCDALDAASRDDDGVRAVLLTGAGPRRSRSGADLRDISGREMTPDGRPDVQHALTRALPPDDHGMREHAQAGRRRRQRPGASASGCSLALAADLVFARRSRPTSCWPS